MADDRFSLVFRLKSVLPSRWFGDDTPILDAVLGGLASGWEFLLSLILYTKHQARIGTASDTWLDLAALDYFGQHVVRTPDQSDAAFRAAIKRRLLAPLATRRALAQGLTELTGRPPNIFEPANATDIGGYYSSPLSGQSLGGGAAYNITGGWGNLALPYQCFVTAFRPSTNGIAYVSGWAQTAGGYGQGVIEYADIGLVQGHVSDSQIIAEVTRIVPVGMIAWLRIAS